METASPQVAVAFVVREKFGWALLALRRLYQYATQPFQLYVVDCGYPSFIRQQLNEFLSGRPHVTFIESHRYLYPNESLNLVIERAQEGHLLLLQNDVMIEEGFLDEILSTFKQTNADIVWPFTFEIHDGRREAHRDEYTNTRMMEKDGYLLVQQPQQVDSQQAVASQPAVRPIEHFEMHTLAMKTAAAKAFYPFPVINTREHIDCAAHARSLGLRAYVNENARANYVLPPICDYDADYFSFRWDRQLAYDSHVLVAKRWNIRPFPSALSFVEQHSQFARRHRRIPPPPGLSYQDFELPPVSPHEDHPRPHTPVPG